MTWKDEANFLDMLLAAREIVQLTADIQRDVFENSRIHQLAIVRLIEIIGEAAKNVSDEGRQAHPEIEWLNIVGMRNRVVHQYRTVDLYLVWIVITEKAPELITQLEAIVPPENPPE